MRSQHTPLAPLFLCPILVLACSPGAPGEPLSDDEHAAVVAALERETGVAWTVRWHADVGTPALLEGHTAPLVTPSGSNALTGARRFLAEHPDLFRIDAMRELADDAQAERDELGMVHLKLAQRRGGLPVWGHELRLHFDGEGSLVRLDGRVAPLKLPERLAPAITSDEALRAARAALPDGAQVDAPQLVLDALGGGAGSGAGNGAVSGDGTAAAARLAWRIEARLDDETAPSRTALFLDALTGERYRDEELLDTLRGSGSGVFGDRREFEVASRSKRFYLEDATFGSPMQRVYSAAGTTRLPGTEVSSDRVDRWDQVATGRGAAVDAAAWLEATEAWYQRVHGRRGPLDEGGGIKATVHYGRAYNNAFWNGKQLAFGDGDGVRLAPLAAALDVVAHEFTHAVSESAAHLGHSGEAGALNEGLSDVFACFVEKAVLGGAANWTIGERVLLGAGGSTYGIRSLADPRRTGSPSHVAEALHTSDDKGGVHANATIAGHAAFLLTEGGTNRVSGIRVDGIGVELAERIFYRALTRYLGPSSDFRDLADATVTAAAEITGKSSPAVRSVKRAWQAVGVLPGG